MSVGKEGGLTSTIWLLDYGAGNVCSLVNAFAAVGKRVSLVQSPQDIVNAKVLYPLRHDSVSVVPYIPALALVSLCPV